jgi:hypothetical protein
MFIKNTLSDDLKEVTALLKYSKEETEQEIESVTENWAFPIFWENTRMTFPGASSRKRA